LLPFGGIVLRRSRNTNVTGLGPFLNKHAADWAAQRGSAAARVFQPWRLRQEKLRNQLAVGFRNRPDADTSISVEIRIYLLTAVP